MASMSRLALKGSSHLCVNKPATTLGISSTLSNNTIKQSITLKSAAAAFTTVGIHTNNVQRGESSVPQGAASPFFVTSASKAPAILLMSKYKPLQQKRNFSSFKMSLSLQSSRLDHQNALGQQKNRRYISSKEITKNMTLFTSDAFKNEVDKKTLQLKKPTDNPLVIIMAWLTAKQKHLKKYAEIYTELGFDVMAVHSTPWQLLWPTKGTQVVAAEMLKFLDNNKTLAPIVLHGFSVGAYLFGEVMLQMSRDMERYSHILNRVYCQIWDSAADITEIPVGFPKSVFPKNTRMQTALRNYIIYHMKTFHNQATVHYIRSSQMFHSTLCKKPALFFVSANDPIGPPSSSQSAREDWERAGVKVTFKCWQQSQHASHLLKHREEYLNLLLKHLEDCGVLEAVVVKQRAKL